MQVNTFDNINQAEAQIMSLPEAELRSLHLGKSVKKETSGKALKQELKDMSMGASEVSKHLNFSPETNSVAIVNTETGNLANTGTPQYDLVTHSEAFNPIMDALGELSMSISGKIRTWDNGNVAVLEAMTDREFTVQGEKYGIGFRVKNTYNKSSSVTVSGFFIRQVCSNGMIGKDGFGVRELRRQHRGEVEVVEEYTEWFGELIEASSKVREVLSQAMEDMFDYPEVAVVLSNAGIPKTKLEEIIGKIEDPGEQVSRKQIYDAVTNYVTHEMQGDVAVTTEETYQKKAVRVLQMSREALLEDLPEDLEEDIQEKNLQKIQVQEEI